MLSFFNNPITLAVLAVAAVGFLVYDVINTHNERQQRQQYRYGSGRGPHDRPPPPDPPYHPPPPPDPPYHRPPPPDPPAPGIRTSVRRRKSKERRSGSDDPDYPSYSRSKKIVSSDSSSESCKSAQQSAKSCVKSNEKKISQKNVLSETTDDGIWNPNVEVRQRKRSLRKNSSSEKSRKGSHPTQKLNVVSLSNTEPSYLHENQQSEQSDEWATTSSSSDNTCISSTESMLSGGEEMYKDNVYKNIQIGLDNSNQNGGYASSSVESAMYEDLEVCESDICLACEENRVNTRAEPCNHRYMCLSCARKVHRITKKCRICRQRIVKFHII